VRALYNILRRDDRGGARRQQIKYSSRRFLECAWNCFPKVNTTIVVRTCARVMVYALLRNATGSFRNDRYCINAFRAIIRDLLWSRLVSVSFALRRHANVFKTTRIPNYTENNGIGCRWALAYGSA